MANTAIVNMMPTAKCVPRLLSRIPIRFHLDKKIGCVFFVYVLYYGYYDIPTAERRHHILKRRQQLFLSINRIGLLLYAPLNAALAVYYLFTGSPLYAALALLTLALLFAPWGLHKLIAFRDSQLLRLLYNILILTVYTGCVVLKLEHRIPLFHQLCYLYCGFFFCIIALCYFFYFLKGHPQRQYVKIASVFGISAALSTGALWELIHIIAHTAVQHVPPTVLHISLDLFACLLGAALFLILLMLSVFRQLHTYPLYALEDFLALNSQQNSTI